LGKGDGKGVMVGITVIVAVGVGVLNTIVAIAWNAIPGKGLGWTLSESLELS
jgi:hypothetical protein